MRLLSLATLLLFVGCSALSTSPRVGSATDDDVAGVHAAVEDYLLGLYDAEPERITRSVHPTLRKVGFRPAEGSVDYGAPKEMTRDDLVALATRWNKDGWLADDAPRVIELIEVRDQTATAKLTAYWGIDDFHLAKLDGRWIIMNIMWQSAPR